MPEQFPKYKLAFFNEYTLRPIFSILGGAGKFIFMCLILAFILLALGFLSAVFTPLGHYAGMEKRDANRELIFELLDQVEELEMELENLYLYTSRIQRILSPQEDFPDDLSELPASSNLLEITPITGRSIEDSLLREQISRLDQRNPFSPRFRQVDFQSIGLDIEEMSLIKPLDGVISQRFYPELGHFGVDIVAPVNSAIKTIAAGTVIWSDWTVEAGNSIAVLHPGGIVSIYKHNSQLLKKVGSFVDSGEAIAIIGNTGELTDGPHLHFEMWFEGRPLNPLDFFDFL